MNEIYINTDAKMNKICCACLKSDTELNPMSFELKKWYQIFIDKAANQDTDMMLCIICKWILTKFIKFVHYCKTANEILNEAVNKDKIQHTYLPNIHNFTSNTYLHSIPSSKINIKTENSNITILKELNNKPNNSNNSNHQYDKSDSDCQNSTYQIQSDSQISCHQTQLDSHSLEYTSNCNNSIKSVNVNENSTNQSQDSTPYFNLDSHQKFTLKNSNKNSVHQFTIINSYEDSSEQYKLNSHQNFDDHISKSYKEDSNNQYKLDSRQSKLDSYENSQQFETVFENSLQQISKIYNENSDNQYKLDSKQSKLDSYENSEQFDTVFENSDEQYVFNDTLKIEYSGDEFQNDDDVPLVMLKSDENRKKKKRKRKTKEESKERDSKTKLKCKKGTKQLKEGFSSRMVQETKEYIVIKLSREQVLNEMEVRSKTEEYLRYPYKCERCVKGFNFEDVLQKHMEKHVSDDGSFQCDMCYQYCASAVSLRGHIKSHTTRYQCKLCGQIRLARQHLLEHYTNTHSNQPITYKCESCQFTTDKRTVMQRHVRSHTASSLYACHKCGKLYKNMETLRVHTTKRTVMQRHVRSHTASSLYACHKCGKLYKNMETLRVHTTIHDKSRFQCKLCNATFVYQTLLKKHELSFHQRRDFYCVECDIEFKTKISLNLHFKRSKKHRDSSITTTSRSHQPVECSICSRSYSNRDTLRAHMYRAHRNKNNVEKQKEESYGRKIEV